MPNTNIGDLFKSAHEDGDLSAQALAALTVDGDIGAQIQAGLGIAPDDVQACEVVLVTIMPDDSSSIRFGKNTEAVRDGHNLVIDALARSKSQDEVLVHTRYLNGTVLFPYRRLADAVRMDRKNYDPNLGTPLYDQTAVLLGTVIAKARELEAAGVPVRTVTLLITDGGDSGSTRQSAASVRAIVEDMLRKETHIVAAMGLSDGGTTDFRAVFREMGIPDGFILTPGNAAGEIRKAFRVFSQSALMVSQGTGGPGKVVLGGFGLN